MNDSANPVSRRTDEPAAREQPLVAIVGGGITGLAAACELRELAPRAEIRLFEAQPRLGGVLQTERRGGYLLEQSADNFITDLPWGVDFCQRLGLAAELLPTTEGSRRAGIVSRGRIEPLPAGFALLAPSKVGPLLASRLLSPWGKLRLACEYFVPRRRQEGDESFANFARRRIGREAYERIAQPLVSGIYTADPERLSMQAALARFVEMERSSGSLIRAARRTSSASAARDQGPRYSLFVAPHGGMHALIAAAAQRLPRESLHLSSAVTRLQRVPDDRGGSTWKLQWRSESRPDPQQLRASAVVLALPSRAAATLLEGVDPPLADDLEAIEYAGCTIALVGCRREQLTAPLDGFGFVVPEVERRPILACSYASEKFPGRAPAGHVLLRVFLGGACHPEMNELTDVRLRELVLGQLGELLGLSGEPDLFHLVRWSDAMPQYYLGHTERVARIEGALRRWPTLALAGNAYHGVGVPQCIHSGQLAARRVAAALG
ncbi:MAG: protoporphyrinogen oxidase [Planctomycetaceae bacterium]|nr:protoporphyrinogen oxidase [Planctomycetaceae bacterium]